MISIAAGLAGLLMVINYDFGYLQWKGAVTSELTQNFQLQYNEPAPGRLEIALAPNTGQEDGLGGGQGTILYLDFQAIGVPSGGHKR